MVSAKDEEGQAIRNHRKPSQALYVLAEELLWSNTWGGDGVKGLVSL